MLERHLHAVGVEQPDASETSGEARARLAGKFPRTALRRMTHLGLLVGSTLERIAVRPPDSVVYASTFAETRALEDFLASFPTPSPLLFQTSIHPGALQQVLIGRQQPVGCLLPLAGGPRIVEHALQSVLLDPADRVILTGGEERGTWMLDHGMAAPRAFAFAAEFRRDAPGAIARVAFAPGADAVDGPCPSLFRFAESLATRQPLAWSGAGGRWSLEWS